ncbi:MAG: helix-turn-helix domain-containing protein [Bifidobacteriaceae bacterium]|nr:helix-turn-helix domain-containing protein [Bifidobacteriaceae bacterium]
MDRNLFRKFLGEVIRAQRHIKGWTLHQLSEMSVVSTTYLSEIERGEKDASSEIMNCVARGLDLTLVELLQKTIERINLVYEVDQLELFANTASFGSKTTRKGTKISTLH